MQPEDSPTNQDDLNAMADKHVGDALKAATSNKEAR